jgi:hypothetical protein
MFLDLRTLTFEPFLRASEVLGGLRSRKEKIITTPPFFGQKIK